MIKDPTTFDPRKAHDLASASLSFLLHEGLFRSGKHQDLEEGLCENVTISTNHLTYFFKLKKAFWSDGSPITAFDFENSWLDQLDPQFPSPHAYLFYCIKNAKKFKNRECEKKDVGIKALHHNLLKIELETPKQDFLDLLSFSAFFPFKESCEKILSSGPYVLKQYTPHKDMVLEKNKFFHDHHLIEPDYLSIQILDSEMTALHLFKSGQLDLIGGPLSPIPIDELKMAKPSYQNQMKGQTLCFFNTYSSIFKNLNLRKAFTYAVDFSLLSQIQNDVHSKIQSFLPFQFEIKQTGILEHNPDQARLYLGKALHELNLNISDLSHLKYYLGAKPEHLRLAQILKDCWKQTLNIDVTLVKLEHKLLSKKLSEKDFDLIQAIWLAPYDSPLAIADRFHDKQLLKNFSGYSSLNIIQKIKEFEVGKHTKQELIASINRELSETIPFFPINNWSYSYYVSPKIKDLCFTNLGTINFTYLKVNEDTCRKHPNSGI